MLGNRFDIESDVPGTNGPGRNAGDDLAAAHIPINDGVGSDYSSATDANTLQDHGASADPHVIANLYLRHSEARLDDAAPDRVAYFMVLVSDSDPLRDQATAANAY